MTKREVKQHQYTSWVNNKLSFDHTTLRDISNMLNDTYDILVTCEEASLLDRELSGEIAAGTVDEILYAIAETFDLNVARKGNVVFISSK